MEAEAEVEAEATSSAGAAETETAEPKVAGGVGGDQVTSEEAADGRAGGQAGSETADGSEEVNEAEPDAGEGDGQAVETGEEGGDEHTPPPRVSMLDLSIMQQALKREVCRRLLANRLANIPSPCGDSCGPPRHPPLTTRRATASLTWRRRAKKCGNQPGGRAVRTLLMGHARLVGW